MWRTDNQVVVWSVAKWKAKSTDMIPGLCALWDLLSTLDVHLEVEYIPGVDNVAADRLSRTTDREDWRLNPQIFARICELRFLPDVDCFATSQNAQVPRFFSWTFDPRSLGTDFFKQKFTHNGLRLYGNPPFSVVGRVLDKVRREGLEMLLVVPCWTGQPWWPLLQTMYTAPPLLLPRAENTFLPVSTANLEGIGLPGWQSLCVQVSGDPVRVQQAQERWGDRLRLIDDQLLPWYFPPKKPGPGWV